jgi:hypothetical protein
VPTAADVAIFDQAATYTVTISGTGSRTALTLLNTAGTVTFTGTTALAVGGLTLTATAVWSNTGALNFSVAGTHTIDTKNVLVGVSTFSASASSWTLASNFRASGTSRLSAGTLDLNGFTLTSDQFYADTGSAARTLAFGSTGQITVTGLVTSVIVDFYNSSFPSALTMTGSKRVNISSARTVVALADLGSYEVDLYVTQGAYSLGVSGSAVVRNADFTGFTGSVGGSMDLTGNLILGAGMSEGDGTLSLTTSGTGLQTITSNGRVVISYLRAIGTGTVQLQDALTFKPDGSLEMNNGVLDLNGFAMEVWQANLFSYDDFGDPTTPELRMGSGSLRVEYGLGLDGGLWDEGYLLPTITGPGTIELFSDTEDFYVGVIGWLVTDPLDPRVAAFPTVRHTGSSPMSVIGNNTFQSFESLSAAGSVTFIFGETSTFGSFNMSGAPGNLKTLTAGDGGYIPGTQATLIKGSPWLVGANSIDDGNNTGLTFASGGGIDYLVISNIRTTDTPIPVEGWILINDSQTANWQNANNTQTSNWQNASNAQTPNWQNIIDTQTPNWQNIIDAQSPGWTPTNQ